MNYLSACVKHVLPLGLLCALVLLAACSGAGAPVAESSGTATSSVVVDSIQIKFDKGIHAAALACEDCHTTFGETPGASVSEVEDEANGHGATAGASELCLQCHENIRPLDPVSDLAELAHQGRGCVDCHDVHTGRAGCTQSGCHNAISSTLYADLTVPAEHTIAGDANAFMCGGSECHALATRVAEAPVYHQPVHRNVACYACHDASGMEVALDSAGRWTTLPTVSHTLQKAVQCTTCHEGR